MRFFFDMNRYARTAESKNFKIIPIDLPFSLFDFVDNHFKGLSSLRRILSQVRISGGKTMVMEEIEISDRDFKGLRDLSSGKEVELR